MLNSFVERGNPCPLRSKIFAKYVSRGERCCLHSCEWNDRSVVKRGGRDRSMSSARLKIFGRTFSLRIEGLLISNPIDNSTL